jgi:hypothetical protein
MLAGGIPVAGLAIISVTMLVMRSFARKAGTAGAQSRSAP